MQKQNKLPACFIINMIISKWERVVYDRRHKKKENFAIRSAEMKF